MHAFDRGVVRDWVRLSAVVATCGFGMSGCKKPDPYNPPDTGVATTSPEPDGGLSCPVDVQDEEAQWPIGQCAPPQQSCEFGQECCCGRCAPSVVCECFDGEWGCYYTDFCFFPSCDEGGTPDPDSTDGG